MNILFEFQRGEDIPKGESLLPFGIQIRILCKYPKRKDNTPIKGEFLSIWIS
ncbi:hypothetical protein KFK09_000076 [Dendrobium nobile]|uniref:Uncharacterized protein n=1 Tax=Dendrobium nobile TaxID=94219 RepID=A0A8T3C4N3_DENNO|nr:hypothetical protein KFK09_004035 [Dendrobium nobile]KAI0530532.1 hypothetical protein KFK09_000076 [Dendrobium nobile]